jgi:DNA-binding MarR family transcriptional regulator
MFGFFSKKAEKRELEDLKNAVQTGFNKAKQDINNISVWVKYLGTSEKEAKEDISELYEDLSSLKEEVENMKNILSILGQRPPFKHRQTVFDKQTLSNNVLNNVSTDVQTIFLENLSPTERAIIAILANTDSMKLSYEDIAAMMGKSKATIRGQINSIKQKSEGLIEEVMGSNNKKRVYIPEKAKEILLKTRKAKGKN